MPGDDIAASIGGCSHAPTATTSGVRSRHQHELHLMLDISKSMSFGSRGVTKLEYASYLGACLAYLAQRQRDRVGCITFDNEIVKYVPPSAKHFNILLHTLDRAKAERRGEIDEAAAQHGRALQAAQPHRPDLGFLRGPGAILESLKPLHFLGNDLIVFHVLDPAELDFGFEDASSFEDLETGEQIPVVPESFRDEYRAADSRATSSR